MKVVMKIVAVYQQTDGGLPGDNGRRIQFDSGENLNWDPYVEYPTLEHGNSTTGWCSINVMKMILKI